MTTALPAGLVLRHLHPSDPIDELTALLHRAYEPLARAGLRYLASWQDEDTTRRRISGGECIVGCLGPRIVATITFHDQTDAGGCTWYDRPDVASFEQFCVDPELQGLGIGSTLLQAVEARARETGAREIACDTAQPAAALIAMYGRRGFREVEQVQWPMANYPSVVLSKTL